MITKDSRFNLTPLIAVVDSAGESVENTRVDIPYPRPDVTARRRPDLFAYPVQPGDTFRGVAQRFLRGRSDLWWTIAEFSGIIDPIAEFKPGKTAPRCKGTVLIPSFETVVFDLLDFERAL